MKRFEKFGGWDSKLNFVDDNNVFVGFDYGHCCCESFGYYYAKDPNASKDNEIKLSEDQESMYNFDPLFHEDVVSDDNYYDAQKLTGGAVAFKLINKSDVNDVVYLILYNHHNGYYSHGFEMKVDEKQVFEGYL